MGFCCSHYHNHLDNNTTRHRQKTLLKQHFACHHYHHHFSALMSYPIPHFTTDESHCLHYPYHEDFETHRITLQFFVCFGEMEASHSVTGGWLLNWNAPTSGPASPAQPSPARLNSPFSTGNDITLTGNGSQQLMENEWMWLWIVLMEAFILKMSMSDYRKEEFET